MREDGADDAFDGVAFHCYGGDVSDQDIWHNAFPTKELYFTECTGTLGSDWWSDLIVSEPATILRHVPFIQPFTSMPWRIFLLVA